MSDPASGGDDTEVPQCPECGGPLVMDAPFGREISCMDCEREWTEADAREFYAA